MENGKTGWFVKLAAGALLTASLAWGSWVTSINSAQDVKHASLDVREEEHYKNMEKQLDRIERKLDLIMVKTPTKR